MQEPMEISREAIQFFSTIGVVAFAIGAYTAIAYAIRPPQVETEADQLELFRERTQRVRVPQSGWIDKFMDDGHVGHIEAVQENDSINQN